MRSAAALALSLGAALVASSPAFAADAPRPPGTGSGETLARVHLVGGAGVRVRGEAGAPFAPRATMPLFARDTLVVPAGEFVIVHLVRNNHLVRVDDDVTLKVTDIVLLSAPRTQESLAAQLERMVSVDEKRAAERIAGTYAGRAAGDAPPPESSGGVGGLGLRGTGSGGGGSGNGIGIGSIGTLGHGSGGTGSGYGSGARSTAKSAPKPAPPKPATPAAVSARAKLDATATEEAKPEAAQPAATKPAPLPAADALKQCLDGELRRLGLRLDRVVVRLRVEGGRIRRLALGGGLATPPCARTLLLDQPYAAPDQTWQSVDLVVK